MIPRKFRRRNTRLLFCFFGLMCFLNTTTAKYPNEIIESPIVTCDVDRIIIKIRTSTSNPSHIYAEDFHETPRCTAKNMNKIAISHGDCGMTIEHMDNPAGSMYRICIFVQIHPLFVTDSDRSYCAQCVYMEANVVEDLEQNITISEMMPNELQPQFDEAENSHCTYSIRKGAANGPEVHAAVVGDTVFHVWQCDSENVGILVQNCHVEDLQGDKILIIDQNGCGVDQYLFKTPEYSNDLQTAFLESNVFKFVDKSMTRFRCQLRLCMKNRGSGCETITPPNSCPNLDVDDNSVHSNSVVSATTISTVAEAMSARDSNDERESSPASPASSADGLTNGDNKGLPTNANRQSTPSSSMMLVNGGPSAGHSPPTSSTLPFSTATFENGVGGAVIHGKALSQLVATPQRSIGPPSIRPYGLSTAQHIVSGKTNGVPPINSGGKVAMAVPTSSGSHDSGGYLYRNRNRRSTMIYGSGTTTSRKKKRTSREAVADANNSSAPPLPPPLSSLKSSAKSQQSRPPNKLPEMDVVGLIRVLDNPEDLEYFEDEKKISVNSTTTVSPRHEIDGASSALPVKEDRRRNASTSITRPLVTTTATSVTMTTTVPSEIIEKWNNDSDDSDLVMNDGALFSDTTTHPKAVNITGRPTSTVHYNSAVKGRQRLAEAVFLEDEDVSSTPPLNNATAEKRINRQRNTSDSDTERKCLSVGASWLLVTVCGLLATLQISAVAVYVALHFPFGKAARRWVCEVVPFRLRQMF